MRTGFTATAVSFLLAVTASAVSPTTGKPDAAFDGVPFDRWTSEGDRSFLPWSVEVVPPELSGHQRLFFGVKFTVEARKLARREVKELLVLVQIEDSDAAVWRTHSSLRQTSGADVEFTQNAFVLPGDYVLSVAISDEDGRGHSFARKKVHVPVPRHEPLPHVWDGLPRVEFFQANTDSPDTWYLPEIEARLNLPIPTRRPIHLDVLVNTTPGDRVSDPIAELRRNMTAVIPPLKVISQMTLPNGTMGIHLLDLAYRQQAEVPDWEDMKLFFTRTNPGIITVQALDAKRTMRNFFVDQLIKKLQHQGDAEHFVIVLSGPAFFEDQEPMGLISLPEEVVPHVFYIRCRAIPRSVREPRPRPRPGARPRPLQRFAFALPLDELERPLDSQGARIFDVISPEQFRRVLGEVIGQISRM